MTGPRRGACSLPEGFDYIDLGELLEVISAFMEFSRAYTLHELEGEALVYDRAQSILGRYRPATEQTC